MRKALVIAKTEFITALASKAFLIGIILVPSLMVGSIFFQRMMGQRVDREEKRFAVIDRTDQLYPVIQLAAEARNARLNGMEPNAPKGPPFLPSRVTLDGRSIEQVRLELSERVARKELFAFVEIPAEAATDQGTRVPLRYHSNTPSYGGLSSWLDAVINQAIIAQKLRVAGVDLQLLRALAQKVPLDNLGLLRKGPDGRVGEAEKVDRIKSLAIPALLMGLMFMVIMSSASPLLNSVMEEKMTRVSEVMLGSVTPFELMLGKLLGSLAVSLVLSLVYMGGGFVAASYWGYGNALPPAIAAWFILYLVLAILMFGAVFMAIGAACTDLKDAQGMMTPVMLIFVMPFFVWQPVMQAPESLFSIVASLVPIASPMLMLLRLSLQPSLPLWQLALSVVLTSGTALVFVWAAAKIFRTGILMQGKSASLAEMIRWVRA